MKKVMVRAWEIAKEGVKKFGGKVKEYFAQALAMAWQEFKKGVNKVKTHFDAVKEARAFSKKHFDKYVAEMKSKGVQVKYIVSDCVEMVAPNGLVAKAYVETTDGTLDGEIVTFASIIKVELANGKTQRGSLKTIKFNKSDYSLI